LNYILEAARKRQMEKKTYSSLILVMAVFAVMVMGCATKNSYPRGDIFSVNNIENTTVSAAALAAVDFTEDQFNEIRSAAGGGFRGWSIQEVSIDGVPSNEFRMGWENRSPEDFNSVLNTAALIFGEGEIETIEYGIIYIMGERYLLSFYPQSHDNYGMYVPAHSMILTIGPAN
jgi:hypothetical protein